MSIVLMIQEVPAVSGGMHLLGKQTILAEGAPLLDIPSSAASVLCFSGCRGSLSEMLMKHYNLREGALLCQWQSCVA